MTSRGGDDDGMAASGGGPIASGDIPPLSILRKSNKKMKRNASFIREFPMEYAVEILTDFFVGIFKKFEFFLPSTRVKIFLFSVENSIETRIRSEFQRIFPSEYSKNFIFPSFNLGKKIPSENFLFSVGICRIPSENKSVGIPTKFSESVEFPTDLFSVGISRIFSSLTFLD